MYALVWQCKWDWISWALLLSASTCTLSLFVCLLLNIGCFTCACLIQIKNNNIKTVHWWIDGYRICIGPCLCFERQEKSFVFGQKAEEGRIKVLTGDNCPSKRHYRVILQRNETVFSKARTSSQLQADSRHKTSGTSRGRAATAVALRTTSGKASAGGQTEKNIGLLSSPDAP